MDKNEIDKIFSKICEIVNEHSNIDMHLGKSELIENSDNTPDYCIVWALKSDPSIFAEGYIANTPEFVKEDAIFGISMSETIFDDFRYFAKHGPLGSGSGVNARLVTIELAKSEACKILSKIEKFDTFDELRLQLDLMGA